jgi:class 3 adenylate cyclase/tetratricopeptide (TPR) repeat protein
VQCVTCNGELIPGKRFCAQCGAESERRCPSCGATVQARFRFCPDCGASLDGSEPPANRLAEHIPDELAQKLRAAPRPALEERKLVTVLFCDLVGSTAIAERLDAEEYRDLLEQYMALAFREIYAFEGIVNTLAGDGLMALFGAPIAHEDAPHRAVRAALAIREALAAFNATPAAGGLELQVRIGIHTGPVIVGTVGNDLKMDYTAVGDTTNLAARLQATARPGTILVSHATHRLVRDAFLAELAGPFTVKGKREPVVAYEIRGTSAATSPMAIAEARGMTPLVGRTVELSQLTTCFERAREGLAQVVAVVGDAGSGKSRLIYEFKQRIAAEPVAYFEARCSALSQSIPYAPMIDMLRQHFGLASDETTHGACGRIVARLAELDDAPETLHPHLCRLLAVHDAGPAGVPPEEQRQETFEAVAKFVFLTSQRRPVVMILEDLHWMDDASREMIALAMTRMHSARVTLIVSHRPDFQPAWRSTAALTHLNLRPLTDDDMRAIMRSVAGGRLPTALEERILAKAEGNPFFTEEITRTLVEDGFLLRGDGHIRLTRPVAEVGIPDTVHELIGARLDRLGPETKRVAQVAAVFGRQFHRVQLTELLAGEGIDVARELERLELRGIVHRKHVLSPDEYRFGESLVQEVAYEALLLKERRQLHERIGVLLERDGSDRDPARIALLAHHFSRGEDRRKAIAALLRAAHNAEALPSYSAAVAFYRQAWGLADPALTESGGADDALKHAVLDATSGLVRVAVLYGPSHHDDVERAAARGRALAAELGNVETLAGLCAYHGMALMSGERERFAEGLALAEEGLAIAQRAHLELVATSISRGLAWSYLLDGQFELARRTIDWVVQDLEVRGQRELQTDVYFGARWVREGVRYGSDDLAGAAESARETYELALAAGNRTAQSGSAATLAQVYFERTEYAEAVQWADRSLEIAQSIGSIAGIRTAAAVALAARLELGEPANAAAYTDAIEEGLAQGGTLPLNSRLVIEALLAVGEVARARRVAEIASGRGGGRLREVAIAAALGDVMLRLGAAHWVEAERWYAQALGVGQAIGARSSEVAALLGLAELAVARGDRETARRQLAVALGHCRELGLRRFQGRAERLLSDVADEAKQLA